MSDPKRKLKGMLARIFSDAVAEPTEREELVEWLAGSQLAPHEVQEVIEDFVATTWKITIADRVVSDTEKQRLREIVNVLQLDEAALPPAWVTALS